MTSGERIRNESQGGKETDPQARPVVREAQGPEGVQERTGKTAVGEGDQRLAHRQIVIRRAAFFIWLLLMFPHVLN